MTPYTATEILRAGGDDIRRSLLNSYLYAELDSLQAALSWHWHRININEHVALLDGEQRLSRHPADSSFGGAEIAIPERPVRLNALTPAGQRLYRLGTLAALAERETLTATIIALRQQLDTAQTILPRTVQTMRAKTLIGQLDAITYRANHLS